MMGRAFWHYFLSKWPPCVLSEVAYVGHWSLPFSYGQVYRKDLTQQAWDCHLQKGLFARLALGWHLGIWILEGFPPFWELIRMAHHALTLCTNMCFMMCTCFPSGSLECWYLPRRGYLKEHPLPPTKTTDTVSNGLPWLTFTHAVTTHCEGNQMDPVWLHLERTLKSLCLVSPQAPLPCADCAIFLLLQIRAISTYAEPSKAWNLGRPWGPVTQQEE